MSGELIYPYDLISVIHADIIISQKPRKKIQNKNDSHDDDFEFY